MEKSKKIIFSADDFAKCDEMDTAILKGFDTKVLTSTCVMSNGKNYEKAMNEILPEFNTDFSQGGLGFHFNVIEGKSLLDKSRGSFLCSKDGVYNKSFLELFLLSFNKDFISEVEAEFRSQLEKLIFDTKKKNCKIDHVNSHVHVHAIPLIFDMVCRLSKEYGIDCVRTQYEVLYLLPLKKYFSMGFISVCLNLMKNLILKFFTLINRNTLKKYNLKTNDCFVGLLTTGFMDEESILRGLKKACRKNCAAEILVHPYSFGDEKFSDKNKQREFQIVKNEKFRTILKKNGYDLVNFSRLD